MSKALPYSENYLKHLSLVSPYEKLWNNEVLNCYPESLPHYPEEWLELLDSLSEEELYKIDACIDYTSIKGSPFGNLCQDLQEIVKLPDQKVFKHELPIHAFHKINDKKEYEIGILAPFINEIHRTKGFSQVVDIGSGVGNLSRVLATHFNIKTLCLEKDDYFHGLAKKYVEAFSTPQGIKNIEFKQVALDEWHDDALNLIDSEALVLGLHACGNLSQRILETAKLRKPKFILNFGCCYLLMNPTEDLNVSSFAKKYPHIIKHHGLTLAARYRTHFDLAEFQLKNRVKAYRYALHLFFYHELGLKEFISVGDSKDKDYHQDFAIYAQKKLKKLNLPLQYKADELNNFFSDLVRQKLLRKMFLCNVIRSQFGRAIEQLILLDRAMYLEEQGYKVTLSIFFDEALSPRNRGLFAQREY